MSFAKRNKALSTVNIEVGEVLKTTEKISGKHAQYCKGTRLCNLRFRAVGQ
jgi:hypothetical protein